MNNYIRTTNGDVKSKILYIGERGYYKSSYSDGPGNLRLHYPGINITLPQYRSETQVINNPEYVYCGGYELTPGPNGLIAEMNSFITSGTQSTASVSCFGCFKGSFNNLLSAAVKTMSTSNDPNSATNYYVVLANEPVNTGTRVCLELAVTPATSGQDARYEMAIVTVSAQEWASFEANPNYDATKLNAALSDYYLDNDSLGSAIAISIYNNSEYDGLNPVQEAQVQQLAQNIAGSVQAAAVLADEDFQDGVFEQVERASITVNNSKFSSI